MNTQIAHATIGNGTAVHAMEFDEVHPKYGMLRMGFSARTMCGQIAAGKGYRHRRTNGAVETEITCAKCLKYTR